MARSIRLLLALFALLLVPAGTAGAAGPAAPAAELANCPAGTVARGRECVALRDATDAELREYLIRQSIRAYAGSCPCPYSVDRAGRRCGGRSAHSRPGGASPLCYPSDVSDADVRRARGA